MAAGGWAALMAAGALAPIPGGLSEGLPWLDKALHVCEYALFAWCLARAARASGDSPLRPLVLACLVATAYGVFLEGLQAWLPYREAEGWDLLANLVGTGVGTAMSVGSR